MGPRGGRIFSPTWFSDHWPYVVLLIASATPLTWFHGRPISFWDVSAPYSPLYQTQTSAYSWFPFLNDGFAQFSLQNLPVLLTYDASYLVSGNSTFLAELVAWWAIFLAQGLGIYALLTYYLKKRPLAKVAALVGAGLYLFNPYAAFAGWNDATPALPLALAALPFAILIIEHAGQSTDFRASAKWGIAFGLLSPLLFVSPPVVVPLFVVLVIVTLYQTSRYPSLGRAALVAIPVTVLVNTFWWAPYLELNHLAVLPLNTIPQSSVLGGVNYWSQVSAPILTVRLLGEISLYGGWWTFSGQFTSPSQALPLALTALPILAFTSLLTRDGSRSPRRLTYAVIAVIGVVFAAGSNSYGLGPAYSNFILLSSIFNPLNYPDVSWLPLAVLGYSVLIACFLSDLMSWQPQVTTRSESLMPRRSSKVPLLAFQRVCRPTNRGGPIKVTIVIGLIALILVSGYPMLSGQVMTNVYNPTVSVPSYVWQEGNYLNGASNDHRTLLLPASLNGMYGFNWSNGFLSYDPLDSVTSANLLANYNQGQSLSNVLFQIPGGGLTPTLFNSSATSEQNYDSLLLMNNVKFIVVRTDTQYYPPYTVNASARIMAEFLDSNPFLTRVNWNSPDLLYEVANPPPLVTSYPSAVSNWIVSSNLLESFSLHDVQFGSQFPNGRGTATYSSGLLTLSGSLNQSVPWTIFQNQLPLGIPVLGDGDLVLISNGSPAEVNPLLGNGSANSFVAGEDSLAVDGFNVTFLQLPSINILDSITFTRINGTVGFSGMFLAYNLSLPGSLANLSELFSLDATNLSFSTPPLIEPENLESLARNLTLNLTTPSRTGFPPPSEFGAQNITLLYDTHDLSFSGFSATNLSISNGTILLRVNNSLPYDILINRDALNLSLESVSNIIVYASNPVGLLVYNDSPPVNASFTSHESVTVSPGHLIEVVDFQAGLGTAKYIGFQTQPYNNTTIWGVFLLNTSARVEPKYFTSVTTYSSGSVGGEFIRPTEWLGTVELPSPGTYLIAFSQAYSEGWQLSLATEPGSAIAEPILVHHWASLDNLNSYVIDAPSAGVFQLSISFQPQEILTASILISAFSLCGMAALLLVLCVVPFSSRAKRC